MPCEPLLDAVRESPSTILSLRALTFAMSTVMRREPTP